MRYPCRHLDYFSQLCREFINTPTLRNGRIITVRVKPPKKIVLLKK